MPKVTATVLRADLYRLLDQVLETGEPITVERPGGTVVIAPERPVSIFDRLKPHPGAIIGDPEDLVEMDWSGERNPDPN